MFKNRLKFNRYNEDNPGRSFRERQLLPEFDTLPEISGDATTHISEDRDR